ncbi:MAG TPA: DUF2877 domain-containing protein [Streptosporangiaceae bacterium]
MSGPRAVFASPAAKRALSQGRLGAVQIVLGGETGTYLTLGQDWLLVVEPDAAISGPLSLAVEGMAQLSLAPGMQVEVRGRQLIVAGVPISLERMRERPVTPVALRVVGRPMAIRCAADAALTELPPVSPVVRRGVDALVAGALAEAVPLLAGLGEGLTPAGDDVLAGYAGWHASCSEGRLRQQRGGLDEGAALSVLAAGRCSPLGLAYLRCAERAELSAPAARLVEAIRVGSYDGVKRAVRGLRKWGASSGLALGWGVAAAASGAPAGLCATK